jgi:hypothetical protein
VPEAAGLPRQEIRVGDDGRDDAAPENDEVRPDQDGPQERVYHVQAGDERDEPEGVIDSQPVEIAEPGLDAEVVDDQVER